MSVALTTNMRRQSASARRVVKGSPAPFPAILAVGAMWYLGMLDGQTPLMRPQGQRVRQHRRQTTFMPRAARRPNRALWVQSIHVLSPIFYDKIC